ncbi:MAG: PepSY-associated TM helix domain-containing protein [Vicinamibacterales bacterium]
MTSHVRTGEEGQSRLAAFRRLVLVLHRWFGVLSAIFLVFVGVTGSVLVFGEELQRVIAPQLYAPPRPGVPPLDLATLAERGVALAPPHTLVLGVQKFRDDQAGLTILPELDPTTGTPSIKSLADLPPEILIDPWTGAELARRHRGQLSEGLVNLVPFLFYAHYQIVPLTMPFMAIGVILLGVVAVFWTLDCFVGFYLTLPVSRRGFWRQWKPAWQVTGGGSTYRTNLDLHRASGLWLWPVLFLFAWSSVMFNMGAVYKPVMEAFLGHAPAAPRAMRGTTLSMRAHPALDWHEALAVGERLMAEQAEARGFTVGEAKGFAYMPMGGTYIYQVRGSLAIEADGQAATVSFDGDTGALVTFEGRSGEHAYQTATGWLRAIHRAKLPGVLFWPYRVVVFVVGIVLALLSATGVYLWWRKRKVRTARRRRASAPRATV